MVNDEVDRFFEVLADPTRRQVVWLLGEGPRRAGQLAAATGSSAPAMSRHLRILLSARLIADERVPDDARLRVFRLRPEPVVAVAGSAATSTDADADCLVTMSPSTRRAS